MTAMQNQHQSVRRVTANYSRRAFPHLIATDVEWSKAARSPAHVSTTVSLTSRFDAAVMRPLDFEGIATEQ
jgi:hypothetical protein